MTDSAFDLRATIARLFVYPIKSCAGVELPEVLLTETGLEFDRAWMVVDAQGEFVTQRELPRMALVQPTLKHMEMVLRAPGMLALHVAFDRVEKPVRVKVWRDEVAAYDMGDIAAQWFSDFLSEPGRPQALRLVRFDPEQKRLSNMAWTGGVEAENQFADGFPLLVTSEASLAELNDKLLAAGHAAVTMARFRPNIVLAGIEAQDEDRVETMHVATAEGQARLQPAKPCPRCPIPDIDPLTAVSSPEVNDMLRTYRANARVDGAITFGMNCIVLEGVEHLLKVGQSVDANYRFE
ncbi:MULTISPECIES: MOSC N-terminal beta barrel domain-containing protein [unclassified Variovorax]|uniref:MOSC domain-containing protein n=1 Tax=unclassified Variovorax TaxID=663243 RepID=UPI0025789F00|nr:MULTISPECIES: MOSC N-terminal beta barrel domain-containing protein [unclassified Variovorax]MDM0089525.1 MOSC N-terminal beta barrel domain-containing protein [Variovorax sp. J22G40]MDM0147597.1 MOSC N-terminal beta barrel domain-containing protein [Variovorax sp. J2P1-31]